MLHNERTLSVQAEILNGSSSRFHSVELTSADRALIWENTRGLGQAP